MTNFWRCLVLLFAVSAVLASAASRTRAEEQKQAETGVGEADPHAPASDGSHASGANINPLSFDPDLAICTLIVFLILLAVLTKFAWKPIAEGLEKREHGIASQIEEAKRANEKANETLLQYQSQLAAAAEESRRMFAEAKRDAEATKERMIAEAQSAAQRERDRAVADIQTARNVALDQVAQKGSDIAISLASQIVRREIRSGDHAQLIKDALEKLPSSN